jgi:hypothetical protein
MIESILRKAGMIHFTRLYRVLCEACQLAKHALPLAADVRDCLFERAYVIANKSVFVARAEFMSKDVTQRNAWSQLVQKLLRVGTVNLRDLMPQTGCDF